MTTARTDVALPAIGEGIVSHEQFEEMPDGTQVAPINQPTNVYTKYPEGWRQDGDLRERYYTPQDVFSLDGYNAVTVYPDGFVPPVPRQPTLRQFQYKYRDTTMTAAERHGIGRDVVDNALREMGVDPVFPPGVGMRITNGQDRAALPEGTVIVYGDPTTPRRFGMWVKRSGRWDLLLGAGAPPNARPVVVHNVAGEEVEQDWLTEVGTDASRLEVAQFRATAYRIGEKVRAAHSWCSTYNAIVSPLGIDQAAGYAAIAVDGISIGMFVSPAQALRLPVGTILRWRHTAHPVTRVLWFERIEGATNSAGTRRVLGYRDDDVRLSSYADRMEVMFIPTAEYPHPALNVDIVHAVAHLGIGTLVTLGSNRNAEYLLCHDRQWSGIRVHQRAGYLDGSLAVPANGTYQTSGLGHPNVVFVSRFGPIA